jgi:hydroxymethylbilane synthase
MGTRGSALALAQARQVARQLEELHPGLLVQETIISTTGDRQQGRPLPEIGGKGLFTLEIEAALLNGTIDFAVHSLKDLPPEMPEGLCLAAVPRRENPCDVLLLSDPESVGQSAEKSAEEPRVPLPMLPPGARVGTSSLRRRALLLNIREDLTVVNVRGNIDTRVRKMHSEGFAAIVLARAGLHRLGLAQPGAMNLPESWFVPAPGQGALALQARRGDVNTRAVLMAIEDEDTRHAVQAERAVVATLEAGCSTPLGALARARKNTLTLHAVVLSPDGRERVAVSVEGSGDADLIGRRAAQSLLDQGAGLLLEKARLSS